MSGPVHILILEDFAPDAVLGEREVRQVLPDSEFLRVETRDEFLAALDSFQPDVILSDYSLPHFDGMAALRLAQKRAPETPFIIVTGSMNEDTAVECMKAGAWDYVIKESARRLGPAVLRVLEERHIRRERRRAEEALRESEERFRSIASNTPDHIFIQDSDLRYVFVVNPPTGMAEADMLGKTDRELLAPEDADKATSIKRRVLESGEPVRMETFVASPEGGEKFFEGVCIPKRDAAGRVDGLFGYFRNVTERVKAQRLLADRQERLRSMASELVLAEERERRRIAEGLHDQISQPLALACLRLEVLADAAGATKFGRTCADVLGDLRQALKTARSLTFEISPPVLYSFGLVEAVRSLGGELQKRSGIAFSVENAGGIEFPGKDVTVLLFQSVREILTNVVKHSKARTCLTAFSLEEDQLVITVRDDGVGCDADAARKRGAANGSFGLFSIEERLKGLGGSIAIESRAGQGMLVTLRIPSAAGARPLHGPALSESGSVRTPCTW